MLWIHFLVSLTPIPIIFGFMLFTITCLKHWWSQPSWLSFIKVLLWGKKYGQKQFTPSNCDEGRFHQRFMSCFCARRSGKSIKLQLSHQSLVMLLWSVRIKAACRTLMKLWPAAECEKKHWSHLKLNTGTLNRGSVGWQMTTRFSCF
jgi:hypothetical protein